MPKIHLDWDIPGLQYALENDDIIVIVDVLRFSSTVVTAVANGFIIYPIGNKEKGGKFASLNNLGMAGRTNSHSLSPNSFTNLTNPPKEIVLYSANGANCAEFVDSKTAYIGCLLNAKSIGNYIADKAQKTGQNVTIIAAGEERAIEIDRKIVYVKNSVKVFAVEDFLGAGAIISNIDLPLSPEAEICQSAFLASQNNLKKLLSDSISGRYLIQTSRAKDIDFCCQLNEFDVIPVISNGKIIKEIK